jgi:flavin-dependent dehydrogenase
MSQPDAAVHDADVLVIGAGPGGSTIAALLAQRGHRVALLEKDHHPRFHIGESLLPANLPLLDALGVGEQVRGIGMMKFGAEFVSPRDGRRQEFLFANAWDKSMPYAYQVRRSQFDEILARNAVRLGAALHEGCRARTVTFEHGDWPVRVQVQREDGSLQPWRARFLVDASGRDTVLATQLADKRRNARHASAAVYGHFSGARRFDGDREGHISIFWFDHGWFWFIPLADGATSVGAVVWPYYLKSRTQPVRDFFLATIELCPPLAERLRGAELVSEVTATGNYSYSARRAHGRHYLLVGDAYAFIDPVFSSGVMLAMHSAFAGADAVEACLRTPSLARAALRRYERTARRGPREFSWFIYRVTSPTMRDLFMAPGNPMRMQEALLSVLAGDIFGRTPIWRAIWAFKWVYRILSLLNPRRTVSAMRRRRLNIRPAERGPLPVR